MAYFLTFTLVKIKTATSCNIKWEERADTLFIRLTTLLNEIPMFIDHFKTENVFICILYMIDPCCSWSIIYIDKCDFFKCSLSLYKKERHVSKIYTDSNILRFIFVREKVFYRLRCIQYNFLQIILAWLIKCNLWWWDCSKK